jgi:predicted transcriptional regulator
MRHQVYPVIDNGALIGLVELASVRALPTERWADVRVRDVMVPRERALVVGDHTRVADTIAELAQTHAHRAFVIDDARLMGLLSLEDVAQEAAKRMQARSEARRVRLRRR